MLKKPPSGKIASFKSMRRYVRRLGMNSILESMRFQTFSHRSEAKRREKI